MLDALDTVTKGKYWEESWRLKDTCCHSNFNERPSGNADRSEILSRW